MKKLLQSLLIAAVFITISNISKATQHIIDVKDTEFVQDFDTVYVGDTIKWVWKNGVHTTTSNGIPNGAAPWSVAIDQFHTSFTYVVKFGGTYNYISVLDAPLMGGSFDAAYPVGISAPSISVFDFNIIGLPSKNKIEYNFSISQPCSIELSINNLMGTKVSELLKGNFVPGNYHSAKILSKNLTSGIYFLVMKTGEGNITKRIVIQ